MTQHYMQWRNKDGKQMECSIECGIDTASVTSVYPAQEPPTKPMPPVRVDKPCKTCGAKGIKRLLVGGAKLLKAELGVDACDEATIIDRRNICESCEEYDFGVCQKCGCFCAAKVKLKSEVCPDGRW